MTKPLETRASTGLADPGTPSFILPFSQFAKANGHAIESWTDLSGSFVAKCGDLQQQAVRFVTRRLAEDLKHQKDLAACKSAGEAGKLTSSFVKTMATDYAEEVARFADAMEELQHICVRFGTTPVAPDGAGAHSASAAKGAD